jgi:pyruvate,water dikinase
VLGGYDVSDRHAREYPELLLKIIRSALTEDDQSRRAAAEQALQGVRARVPAAHQARFEELLAEAREPYRLRDERVFYGDALAVGVVRRAVLAAGQRLKARGRVEHPEDLVDATASELLDLVEGRPGPSAAELARRAAWRRDTPLSSAPPRLGFEPSEPPPAEWLPGSAARIQRIITLVLSLMFDARKDSQAADATRHAGSGEPASRRLKGFPVSGGVYEGPVRVVHDAADLSSILPGEVLVAVSTGPTFNVVLPLIGALVTERGGVLSHAAIVSREYGLPGVVGCTGAASALKTGTRVRVDGNTGEVWTLN